MPTDEQRDEAEMVKALREWGEERTGVSKGYSALLSKPVTTGVIPTEGEVRAFASGYRSRDAEVQALRERNNQLMEALKDYVDADEMAVGEGYGTYPKSEHRRIRALVAGEEGGDND